MAMKRQRGAGWEYCVKKKGLLDKPIWLSFENEAEGDAVIASLEASLKLGIVPQWVLDGRIKALETIADVVKEYETKTHVAASDRDYLAVVVERVGVTEIHKVTYAWVVAWVEEMKHKRNLSPVTIRHHVGALARCFDWAVRSGIGGIASNPIRLLPKRYAAYNDKDVSVVSKSKLEIKRDVERDRRLSEREEASIRGILAGNKPKDRERALELKYQGALELLFDLALESAMRLREMFTLELSQVKLEERTIFLIKTKNGRKRQVPLTSVALAKIAAYMEQVKKGERGMEEFTFDRGMLFPWYAQPADERLEEIELKRVTTMLSRQFARIFDAAGAADLHFHDLRHEATSRLYERTTLSDLEIAKITGHSDPRMLARYANLRASTLASKLW